MFKNPKNIPVKEITFKPSTLEGQLDSYSIADGQNARVIMAKLRADLGREDTPDLLYRIYQADRLGIMLETGTDRDKDSNHWATDPSISAEDKTFLDNMGAALHYTTAKLGMRYFRQYGQFCIAVYRRDAFEIIDDLVRLTAQFKDKDTESRLDSLLCVYIVKAEQTNHQHLIFSF